VLSPKSKHRPAKIDKRSPTMQRVEELRDKFLAGRSGDQRGAKTPKESESSARPRVVPSMKGKERGSVAEILSGRAARPDEELHSPLPSKLRVHESELPHHASVRGRRHRRKRRRHKKDKRRSSSRSSGHSTGYSGSSSSFHFASGHGAGQESAIMIMARKHPGRLLKGGLKQMQLLANPTLGLTGGGTEVIPPSAMQYLQQVLVATRGQNLKTQDRRELQTLATGMDLLVNGKLAEVGDLLMQRFKALESPTPDIGAYHELLPVNTPLASSIQEREMAARMSHKVKKLDRKYGRGAG